LPQFRLLDLQSNSIFKNETIQQQFKSIHIHNKRRCVCSTTIQ